MAMVFSMSLFSCTQDSIAETDSIFDTQATEGDDGQVDDGRGNDE